MSLLVIALLATTATLSVQLMRRGPHAAAVAVFARPPSVIDTNLKVILTRARRLVAPSDSTWSRAAAVRNLVRASLPKDKTCWEMAIAFWKVGSTVGLPLRLVFASANSQNSYDTHTTVEVWLAPQHRWAISDPTFNGYWTVGEDGPPVGALVLQRAARGHRTDTLYWHATRTENSSLPSSYYVDPTYLYRDISFPADVPGEGRGDLVAEKEDARASLSYVLTSGSSMESLPPSSHIPVVVVRSSAASSARRSELSIPPPYADRLLSQQRLHPSSDRRALLPLPSSHDAKVVSIDARSGDWSLTNAGRNFTLDAYRDMRLSPILDLWPPPLFLTGKGHLPRSATASVWSVKTFPHEREV
jgi:hypothetical protein